MSPDDTQARCEELFMACAPYVRAEQEAEDALVDARATLNAARKVAALTRRVWVDNILKHDHRALCLGLPPSEMEARRAARSEPAEEAADDE